MIVNFKGRYTIDGETYPAGEHVVSREVAQHWYLQALITDGLVTVIQDDEPEVKTKAVKAATQESEEIEA